MDKKIRVAVLGYGNIGKACEETLSVSPDMELAGIWHHYDDLSQINADVIVVSTPTREVPRFAAYFAERGICTVDSFDIHGQIYDLRQQLMSTTKQRKSVSVIAAGWDPGSDSMVRALLEAIAPAGLTYTNFGPGRSMGHTVAAKAIDGVRNALSMTIPLGTSIHRRMVYVELKPGADFKTVEKNLLADDYFAHDETHVIQVDDVETFNNMAHGVNIVRNGVSGTTHNQHFEFNMTINNPSLTGQVLVSVARAAYRMQQRGQYGAYTMIELAPIDMLPGNTEAIIRHLV